MKQILHFLSNIEIFHPRPDNISLRFVSFNITYLEGIISDILNISHLMLHNILHILQDIVYAQHLVFPSLRRFSDVFRGHINGASFWCLYC